MKKNNFFIGAAIGAALGAVTGILFAPKSGKETRKILGKKAEEYANEGKELINKTTQQVEDKIQQTAENVAKKMKK